MVNRLMIHTHESSMVLLAMLEAISKIGDEGAKIWVSDSIAQFERATEEPSRSHEAGPSRENVHEP